MAAGLGPDGAKAAAMVTVPMATYRQGPVPLHGAPQPLNPEPAAGVAVSTTSV